MVKKKKEIFKYGFKVATNRNILVDFFFCAENKFNVKAINSYLTVKVNIENIMLFSITCIQGCKKCILKKKKNKAYGFFCYKQLKILF